MSVAQTRVGLSMMVDKEECEGLPWRTPVEGPHEGVIGATQSSVELHGEVIEGVETVVGVEDQLVLSVGSLGLAVLPSPSIDLPSTTYRPLRIYTGSAARRVMAMK